MKATISYLFGIIAGFLMLSSNSYGQPDAVTGFVYDENSSPLPGITVTLLGTTLGSVTGLDGSYTINGINDPYCDQTLTVAATIPGYFGTTVEYYEHCDGGTQIVNLWVNTGNEPLMVTNTNDDGPGSLRQAIVDANDNPGKDYIHFNMIGDWVHFIELESALPAITDAVVINGFSQPAAMWNTNGPGLGFNTDLKIELDGSGYEGNPGLMVMVDNCEIMGLIINRFSSHGISLYSDNNLVRDCFIGVDSLGSQSTSYGNDFYGIEIYNASNNEIRNCIISANGGGIPQPGITITWGSTLNRIAGNLIGTDISGLYPMPNGKSGIEISEAPENIIGGPDAEDRNVIYDGIEISGTGSTGNKIMGNYIGPDVTGQEALDQGRGIRILSGASDNEIGPDNVISGVTNTGLWILDQTSSNNRIFGNNFGLAADGDYLIGNSSANIIIQDAINNRIGGVTADSMNVISGSFSSGIVISGVSPSGNHVLGNYIGTNSAGTQPRGNQSAGVLVDGSANNNTIGPGNLISGNNVGAISIGNQTDHTQVINNLIGTDYSGTTLIANQSDGISISGANNYVEGNTVCGAGQYNSGITVTGASAIDNTIVGNYIGTNASSQAGLGNGRSGIFVSLAVGTIVENNVISGNGYYGIDLENSGTSQTLIISNKIGTNVTGDAALGNGQSGIQIANSQNNTIGPGNVISGNGNHGIILQDYSSTGNIIIGNLIGTNATGSEAIPNTYGITVWDANTTIIGGTRIAERNIISGNEQFGIDITLSATNTRIMGNFIGTDVSGELPIPNASGILCDQNTTENYIGTGNGGAGNLIAFNNTGIWVYGTDNYIQGNIFHDSNYGIAMFGNNNTVGGADALYKNYFYRSTYNGIQLTENCQFNLIEGNQFGLDLEGRLDQTDGDGAIRIDGSDNIVRDNLISGYNEYGIRIGRAESNSTINSGNLISGNTIGLNASGDGYIPNENGIIISRATDNVLSGNVIAGNTGNGIQVFDPTTINNQFTGNLIYNNGELGIDLNRDGVTENDIDPPDPDEGPNHLQNFPVLDTAHFEEGTVYLGGSLRSNSNSTYVVEFFSSGVSDQSGYGEGEFFLGSETFTTNSNGYAWIHAALNIQGYGAQVITATATDVDGNTSEFSQAIGDEKDQFLAFMPFIYTLNSEGLSTVPDEDYQNAIRSAFQTWNDIPTAEIELTEAEDLSDEKYAKAMDGINLISFQDDRFPFAKGVLAVTTKTLRVQTYAESTEILDADIIFNPAYIHDPLHSFAVLEDGDVLTNAFDIQSVATHEIGHVLGMIHSGVYSSTMFFMLGYGASERELDTDDMAWASYRYPAEDFEPNYGMISGRITYGDIGDVGDPSSHPPVAGALVLAVNTDTNEKIHAYTDADGNYTVPIPMESIVSDQYWIYIQPLDGDVYGTPLKPENISPYIYSHTIFTDFPEEFYDDQESADDNPDRGTAITVYAGGETSGINLITNRDLTPPTVLGTSLDGQSEDIALSPTLAIKFSEPVDIYSFDETTCYLDNAGTQVEGDFILLADSTHIVLMKPVESLSYSTTYTLHIQGITDLKNNALATPYTRSFTTLSPDTDPPEIYDVIPAQGEDTVDVTKPIKVFFSEPMNKSSVENAFTLGFSENDPVDGYFSWNPENTKMTFYPEYSLLEGTEYLIHISTEALDLSGNALEHDNNFSFSTVEVAPPQILYLGPGDGKTGISIETSVVIKFTEPMALESFNVNTFTLAPDGSDVPVTGTYEYLDDDRTIVFRPDQALDFQQLYNVTLTSAISDMSDPKQYLQETTSSFTTAPEPVSPHIISMEPAFGAVGAQTTIIGSGFDPDTANNVVMFDGIAANVIKSTLETVTVLVPYGAEDGPVTISVNEVNSDNSFEFDVAPSNTDPSTDVIASVSTGSHTRAIVINPDAAIAYVTNWGANTVTPIDLSPEGELSTFDDIQVGVEPMDIDLNSEGTLAYVTNYLSNTVSVIGTDRDDDPTFHHVTKEIPVGYHPYGVAVSSDNKVYVANNESEYVSVIEADPNSGGFDHVIANLKTGTANRSIVVTPDAALILVTGDNGVTIIDRDPTSPTFNDVVASASTGTSTRHIAITPDAALALATTEDGVILIIDIFQPAGPQFGNVIASIKTGSSARNITISPDAMYVYITNPDENTVSVYQLDYSIVPGYGASLYNPEGLVPVATIEVDDDPYAIAGYPGLEYILVTHDSEEGGVSIIGIDEEYVDPIYSLSQLVASIEEAIDDDEVAARYGNRLLTDLEKVSEKILKDELESASDLLYTFIEHVMNYMRRGAIPEMLGNAWIDAANRLRERVLKELEDQQSLLKRSSVTAPGIISRNNSQENANKLITTQREIPLKLVIQPNPLNDYTRIYFDIPEVENAGTPVIMRIFNTSGQVVKTLVHTNMQPGRYSVLWNADLDNGGMVPDGIYFLDLRIPGQRKSAIISVIR